MDFHTSLPSITLSFFSNRNDWHSSFIIWACVRRLTRRFIYLMFLSMNITFFWVLYSIFSPCLFLWVLLFLKKWKKKKMNETQSQGLSPTITRFITSHHKQPPPLKNEEKNTTLSTILKRVLLKLKKSV